MWIFDKLFKDSKSVFTWEYLVNSSKIKNLTICFEKFEIVNFTFFYSKNIYRITQGVGMKGLILECHNILIFAAYGVTMYVAPESWCTVSDCGTCLFTLVNRAWCSVFYRGGRYILLGIRLIKWQWGTIKRQGEHMQF